MRLYVLRRKATGYDEAAGFVIRAASDREAREAASRYAGDEGPEAWLKDAMCRELQQDGALEIVLRDFKAG